MSSRMLVLACSATKRPTSNGRAPAFALYDGPAWRVYRAWAAQHPVQAVHLPTYVLSARHGLIPATQVIEEYDQRMDDARAVDLANEATHWRPWLDAELGRHGDPELLVYGGRLYAEVFLAWMPDHYEARFACDGARGIGDMLGELKSWLNRDDHQPELPLFPKLWSVQ